MRSFLLSMTLAVLRTALLCLPVRADDIDLFTRDLDLSGLQLPARQLREPPEENRNLFEAWDRLPEALRTPLPEVEAVQTLTLPAGLFLAVPNPVNLPDAYTLLSRALLQADLAPVAPLVVLIHTDGNVSVGCRVNMTESTPLPLGTDLSYMPERRLLVTSIEADTARRTESNLAAAAARLRQHAHRHNITVQTRELYLLPQSPGQILFGLLIE
ncbi:MAG: hypothetical protein JJU05_11270 [Verrucomicrobia bacterium]|nr:hypothetical protein [Verrucomicrobiota bacterium]MCH8527225.1 hypothetical protein [Kiritimatiellia bacterium]